jgi:predicted acyltransferase
MAAVGEQNTRLISLDVFRGLTIAGMVLVNNPGTSPVYWPLDHAEWNGLTPTDWIFPFFLFIVGVAISISLGRVVRTESGSDAGNSGRAGVYTKIISRAVSIYLLGAAVSVLPFFQFQSSTAPDWLKMLDWLAFAAALLFLLMRNYKVAGILAGVAFAGIAAMNLAGYNIISYDFGTIRIMGVLQRIAVCYLITSLIFLHTNWKQQMYISAALLLGYCFIMTMIPVPGCEITTINDKACNLAAYLDRLIITEPHIWRFGKVYDPEGLLSTIPAIVTTISGVLAGTWLMRRDKGEGISDKSNDGNANSSSDSSLIPYTSSLNTVSGLFFFGVVLFALGWIWNFFFPFNKALWTSSYVLVTTGLALLTLGCCYWLIDIKGYRRWAQPFVIFGSNALALFVFSGLFARMMSAFRVAYTAEGKGISIQKWLVDNVFLTLFQPINASLAYAISFILFFLFLMWLLYRKGIYIKV